jgi:hypothetical protein
VALPDDDVPTMTGTPGDRRIVMPVDGGDDTTTAEAGPPASHLREDDGESDAEDRTVQQKVSPPRRTAPMPLSRPAVRPPSRPDGTPRAKTPLPPPIVRPPPATQPPATLSSSMPPPQAASAPSPSASAPSTTPGPVTTPHDIDDDIELEDDDDAPEDSVTTMAPRLSASLAALAIPGSVEIRTVEHDDLLEETEVRTRPGTLPNIPMTMRAEHVHEPSQPPPPPRPAAGVPASMVAPSTEPEDDDDGVTTEAQAPRVGSAPELAASIGILPTSSSPVTEPQAPPTQAMNADLAAPTRPGVAVEALLDTVDELATRPGIASADEPLTRPGLEETGDPPTRPGVESTGDPPTRPGVGDAPTSPRKLPRLDGYANDEDEEDGVTTRGPAADAYGIRDATLDDSTDGTTQKLKSARKRALSSPADSEAESITTQAPGPLTNILRIIASEPGTPQEGVARLADEEQLEELEENRTAVMANAPLKRIVAELTGVPSATGSGSMPAIRPTGPPLTMPHGSSGARASAAPRLAATSESGLRIAGTSGERASLGVLGVADARASGIERSASPTGPRDVRPFAATEAAFSPGPQPSVHDVDLGKGPPYGLLVGIVAVISIIIPVTLFVVLKGREAELVPVAPSEAASELQQHDATPRGKVDKKAAAVAASASAAPSASSSAHKPPVRPPLNRR